MGISRMESAQCGMCQNRCHVVFTIDEFGLVRLARRQRFSAAGSKAEQCPNLLRVEGESLPKAIQRISIGALPTYIPTGGH